MVEVLILGNVAVLLVAIFWLDRRDLARQAAPFEGNDLIIALIDEAERGVVPTYGRLLFPNNLLITAAPGDFPMEQEDLVLLIGEVWRQRAQARNAVLVADPKVAINYVTGRKPGRPTIEATISQADNPSISSYDREQGGRSATTTGSDDSSGTEGHRTPRLGRGALNRLRGQLVGDNARTVPINSDGDGPRRLGPETRPSGIHWELGGDRRLSAPQPSTSGETYVLLPIMGHHEPIAVGSGTGLSIDCSGTIALAEPGSAIEAVALVKHVPQSQSLLVRTVDPECSLVINENLARNNEWRRLSLGDEVELQHPSFQRRWLVS